MTDLALREVHRYEGTVNQFLGDGFMALFGAPVAHEDHARRAVPAALGLQRSLRAGGIQSLPGLPPGEEISVRMGLNTGLVMVGSIGDNLRMDYTAVGDTTNLAARLQQVAEPDTILISETTRRLVQGAIRLEALPAVQVKGKAEPVTRHKVLGLGARCAPLAGREERALSPFVGRERELTALEELLAQTESGNGQVVGVVGEAGVGKSRLAEAVTALQEALGHVEGLPAGERDRHTLDLVLRLVHSLYFLGRFPEIRERLLQQQERLERLQEPRLAGPYAFWLSHALSYLGEYEPSVHWAQRSIAIAQQCGDETTMGQAYYVLARNGFWLCQFPQGIAHGRQAVSLLERTGKRWWLGMAHWAVGINYTFMGELTSAWEPITQTQAISDALGDPRLQCYAAWSKGYTSTFMGD